MSGTTVKAVVFKRPLCYNRKPFKRFFMVQDGWTEDGRRKMKRIPNKMSRRCVQWEELGEALKAAERGEWWRCEGCHWYLKQEEDCDVYETFEQWMEAVNNEAEERGYKDEMGHVIESVWQDLYDDGYDPEDAVTSVFEEEDEEGEDDDFFAEYESDDPAVFDTDMTAEDEAVHDEGMVGSDNEGSETD